MNSFSSIAGLLALILALLLVGLADAGQKPQQPKRKARRRSPPLALRPIVDEPGLPRVLLIGDSISIGYTIPVRNLLKGKANVHRPTANCGPTTRGLGQIDQWLGDGPWDVIHFNWGLHDLKYLGPNGQNFADPHDPESRPQVPLDEYEKNLRKLVERLKQTGATLIWRSTTPVPEGAKGRVVGDAAKYNRAAAKIMKANGIAIDDMYGYAKPRLQAIQLPGNVHFTREGYEELARHVAAAIEAALKRRETKRGS